MFEGVRCGPAQLMTQSPGKIRPRLQVSTATAWTNHVGNEEGHAVAPTLTALPLRVGGLPSALLAAGAHSAAVLSEHGRILDELELPVRP